MARADDAAARAPAPRAGDRGGDDGHPDLPRTSRTRSGGSWLGFLALLAAAYVVLLYGFVWRILILELALRPAVEAASSGLTAKVAGEQGGVPLRFKLFACIPLSNVAPGWRSRGCRRTARRACASWASTSRSRSGFAFTVSLGPDAAAGRVDPRPAARADPRDPPGGRERARRARAGHLDRRDRRADRVVQRDGRGGRRAREAARGVRRVRRPEPDRARARGGHAT